MGAWDLVPERNKNSWMIMTHRHSRQRHSVPRNLCVKKPKLLASLELLLVPNRAGANDAFDSLAKWVWGHTGQSTRVRTPELDVGLALASPPSTRVRKSESPKRLFVLGFHPGF